MEYTIEPRLESSEEGSYLAVDLVSNTSHPVESKVEFQEFARDLVKDSHRTSTWREMVEIKLDDYELSNDRTERIIARLKEAELNYAEAAAVRKWEWVVDDSGK